MSDDIKAKLGKLKELLDSGLISKEAFDEQQREILAQAFGTTPASSTGSLRGIALFDKLPSVQTFPLSKKVRVKTGERVIKEAGWFTARQVEPVFELKSLDVGIKMLKIPSGTFNMGSSSGEDHEKPIREVTLSGFQLSATPVTQGQYEAIMGENPSEFTGEIDSVNRPVENVSWFDAVRFCNKLSEKQGLKSAYRIGSGAEPTVSRATGADGFRLPTAAEWE